MRVVICSEIGVWSHPLGQPIIAIKT